MTETLGYGPHVMLDLNQCNFEKLNSVECCFRLLNELPDKIGMTKITQPYVFPYQTCQPEDQGITGIVMIAESHISIHTYPKREFAFIDIFSCKPFNTDDAIQFCVQLFESKDPESNIIIRGQKFNDAMSKNSILESVF